MAELFKTNLEILDACIQSVPESLTLEFKRKEEPASALLSRTDRRNISKSVAAFANAEGGILVFGLATATVDGLDVASHADPISDLASFRNQFEAVCIENISPPIPDLSIETVPQSETADAGFLVCRIPASLTRPHMSTAAGENRYYRRSFSGNLLMTPSEIKDQILAVREAIIVPSAMIRGGSFSNKGEWISISFRYAFSLENTGNRICKNPFLRVRANHVGEPLDANFDRRLNAWKSDLPVGVIIHVDDSLTLFSLQFLARVFIDGLRLEDTAAEEDILRAVRIYDGRSKLHDTEISGDSEIDYFEFEIIYGAENAVARREIIKCDRDEVAAAILINHGDQIRDMVVQRVSPWRSYLIDRLKDRLAATAH